MAGANVFAYDGTSYKPTNRSSTAAIASRTASGYTSVTYCYQLSKPAAVTVSTQIWQGFPPAPSQVTFAHGFTGVAAPDSVNRTTISWTCSSSTLLSRFELYRKIGTGAFTAVSTTIASSARSYVVDSHAAGTLYTYYVKAVGISGLTLNGAENSFTLSAPAITGVSMSITATTSSSVTYRSTFPAGVWQRVVWQNFGPGYAWTDITSATIGSTATTADYLRTGLSERTGYYSRAVLYDYNNFSMASDLENYTYRLGTTLNAPPAAPTLSSISAVQVSAPAKGSNGGYATSGEVRKSITVGYSIAADTDYKNHSIYLYDGASGPVNFIAWSGDLTTSSLTSQTFTGLMPSTKYWALVRQRDNNSGETDNATGWQSVTTQAVGSFVNADAYDTNTGTTYYESGVTTGLYTNIAYLTTAVAVDSSYGGTKIWGGSVGNTYDNSAGTYLAWRTLTGDTTPTSGSVGNINFAMRDARDNFLDYAIYATNLTFTERKHNVSVQMYNSAGTWLGGGAANTNLTRNSNKIVYTTPDNTSFAQYMSWAAQSVKSTAAKGATTYGGAGNGGTPSWNMYLSIRNPVVSGATYYVHLTEYDSIGMQYSTELSYTTTTNTPAVTRYY
jgi:hypothetical protein